MLRAFSLLLMLLAFTPAAFAHGADHESAQQGCETRIAPSCGRAPTPAFDASNALWWVWHQGGHIYVQQENQPAIAINQDAEVVDDQGEDRPQIAFGPEQSVYLIWTRKLDKPWTGDIRFSRSVDGGRTFSQPVTLNDDRRVIAHRFPTLVVNEAGTVFVAWIDKRDQQNAKDKGETYAGAGLYYTWSEDRGTHFAPNLRLAEHSCECCRIAMALDDRGLPALLYRQVFEGDIRDHALIRFQSADSPLPLQRASVDEWKLTGCPHHGPALAVDGQTRHQVWFSAGRLRQGLFYQRISADKADSPMSLGGASAAHAQVAVTGSRVVLAWKDLDDQDRSVIMIQQSRDGGKSWSRPSARLNTSAGSDHPLLLRKQDKIYLAWRTDTDGNQLVRIDEEQP